MHFYHDIKVMVCLRRSGNWKGFLIACMPNMKSLPPMVKKLWPWLEYFASTCNRQTDSQSQTDRGHKIILGIWLQFQELQITNSEACAYWGSEIPIHMLGSTTVNCILPYNKINCIADTWITNQCNANNRLVVMTVEDSEAVYERNYAFWNIYNGKIFLSLNHMKIFESISNESWSTVVQQFGKTHAQWLMHVHQRGY